MKIIAEAIVMEELRQMTKSYFGNLVKAVVDVEKELIALDAELHSDLEAFLLSNGSKQKDLWGINIYPDKEGDEFIEFDSVINLRPSQDNRTRGVDNKEIQKRIIEIINRKIIK